VGVNRIPYVQGRCPACGHEVLILGEGGYVTCSLIDCPDPEAVTKMLERVVRTPRINQDAHYVSHGTPVLPDGSQAFPPACRAAKVTAVEDPAGQAGGGIVSLTVFNPDGWFCNKGVPHVNPEHMTGGSWHGMDECDR
jgi:Family of unknown function (DUF6085)